MSPSERRRFTQEALGRKCDECGHTERRRGRYGDDVCAACGAPWPRFLVDGRGP